MCRLGNTDLCTSVTVVFPNEEGQTFSDSTLQEVSHKRPVVARFLSSFSPSPLTAYSYSPCPTTPSPPSPKTTGSSSTTCKTSVSLGYAISRSPSPRSPLTYLSSVRSPRPARSAQARDHAHQCITTHHRLRPLQLRTHPGRPGRSRTRHRRSLFYTFPRAGHRVCQTAQSQNSHLGKLADRHARLLVSHFISSICP